MKIVNWKTPDDTRVEQIHKQIDAKRQFLLDQQTKVAEISQQNHFLEEVKKDYAKYHGYIVNQKREQVEALNLLNKYIGDLTFSGQLSKQNMKDARQEQHKILGEMDIIKRNLNSIVNVVGNISENKNLLG